MRALLLSVLLGGWLGGLPVFAEDKAPQAFEGTGALTTAAFSVQDKWEVRWDCPDVVSITICSPDGAIVAGASSASRGSLYQAKGGSYYLQISGVGEQASKWHVSVVQLGAEPAPGANASLANYFPPAPTTHGSTNTVTTPATPIPPALTNIALALSVPASPIQVTATNAPAATPATDGIPEALAQAVVLVKGDIGEGTGFLVKTADGPMVVTNQHVVRANANLKILTTTGAQIKTLGLKGASDRDLMMFKIMDDHYTYFDLATDVSSVAETGDTVITPGNSEGGEVMLNTKGTVLGIGPERIEFSNPIYHGNSGGPVYHVKSGKVLGVVTQAMKVDTSNDIDKASFENKGSAISGAMRYFGFRLDNVPKWEAYDWNRFLNETTFLRNFHDQSRCLDSFMNGARYEKARVTSTDEYGPPNARYYLRNEKIATAQDNFHKFSTDADNSQRLDAWRELIMNLQGLAKQDVDAIQDPSNFYSFDQLVAAEEIKYRKALQTEIEKMGDKMSDMGH